MPEDRDTTTPPGTPDAGGSGPVPIEGDDAPTKGPEMVKPGVPSRGPGAIAGRGPARPTYPSSVPTVPLSTAAAKPYREITVAAILFALVVGVIMNAAITYAGLKIGFTIVGSSIAAVLGFGVLRGIVRLFVPGAGTIVETNIAQTVASSVNTSNSGVIFTVPVLFLLGISLTWSDIDFWLITLACIAGALLGCAFIIPLRKQMIDIERLRFPSAVGVASILRSPGGGLKKTGVLIAGILLGAAIYLPTGLPSVTEPVPMDEIAAGDDTPTQVAMSGLIANDLSGTRDNWDTLDEMLFEERISFADAQRTREIAAWIRSQDLPAGLIARGETLLQKRELASARLDAANRLATGDWTPRAGEPETGSPEATAELLRGIIRDADTKLATLTGKLAGTGETAPSEGASEEATEVDLAAFASYPDELAIRAHQFSIGERPIEDLADTNTGFAGRPAILGIETFGYADLQWRLPEYFQRGSTSLAPNLDHDGNQRPDLAVTDSTIDIGRLMGLPGEYQLIFAIAPFALGAGFITGRAGLFVLAGGILAYFVINPIVYQMGWLPANLAPHEAPGAAFGLFNRPLGIGLLLGGAAMGVIASSPSILAALKSVARPKGTGGGKKDELGLMPLILAVLGGLAMLFLAADFVGNKPLNEGGVDPISGEPVSALVETAEYNGYTISFASEATRAAWVDDAVFLPDTTQAAEGVDVTAAPAWDASQKDVYLASKNAKPGWLSSLHPHLRAGIIAVVGALWIWFAGIIIAQCTGMTDWSPISGMALLTVVLVLLLAGTGAVLGAVLIGAALCVAITLAADMMADLKTGYLVGGKPRKQQLAELATVGIGPVVAMLTVLLIANVNLDKFGVPFGPGTDTSAPQAQALQAIITGVQGGDMPYYLYGFGALIGAVLGLGSFSGLGVLVGLSMYLPFVYIATYGVGCVIAILVSAFKGKRWTEEWGVPFAAGLIVGESILALILNMYILGTSG